MIFRMLLFKLFNKIETWQRLEQRVGPVTWPDYNFDRIPRALDRPRTARADVLRRLRHPAAAAGRAPSTRTTCVCSSG